MTKLVPIMKPLTTVYLQLPCSQLSLVHQITKMVASPWNNGLIVTAVDQTENSNPKKANKGIYEVSATVVVVEWLTRLQELPEDTPNALLNEVGADAMHPFIPVEVEFFIFITFMTMFTR